MNYTEFSKDDQTVEETFDEEVVEEIDIEKDEVVEEVDDLMGMVMATKLYLREEPSKDSEAVKILNKDDELQILDENGEWLHVCTGSGAEGYVMKEFILF